MARKAVKIAVTIAVIVIVAAVGGVYWYFSQLEKAKTVKIGVVSPLSGWAAGPGIDMARAVEMVVDEWNTKGGVLGRKIEVIKLDDECKVDVIVAAFEKLVTEYKVDIVIGGYSGSTCLAAMDVAAKYGIPYLMGGCADVSIREKFLSDPHKYWSCFKTLPGTDEYRETWRLFIKHIVDTGKFTPKTKTIAMIFDADSYSRTVSTWAREGLEADGWKIVAYEMVAMGTVEYVPLLTKIKALKPDIMWSCQIEPAPAVALLKQFKAMEIPALFTTTWIASTPDYLKLAGEDANYVVQPMYVGMTPRTAADFISKFEKRYGIYPDTMGGQMYDVTQQAVIAFDRAGSTDPRKFVDAFYETDYRGTHGRYVYNRDTNEARFGLEWLAPFGFQVINGEFVYIWPLESATGEYIPQPWIK